MKNLILILIVFISIYFKKKTAEDLASTNPVVLKTTVLANQLAFPWELEEAPNDEIWFTEKGGKISRLKIETKEVNTIFTIPDVVSNGEGGLLGMVLSPNFSSNPFVYV